MAAIGLVSSSSWLLGGLCISAATGFSVQVAHLVGAGNCGMDAVGGMCKIGLFEDCAKQGKRMESHLL